MLQNDWFEKLEASKETFYEHLADRVTVILDPLRLFIEMMDGATDCESASIILEKLFNQATVELERLWGFLDERDHKIRLVMAKADNSERIPAGTYLKLTVNDIPDCDPGSHAVR